MARPIFKKRLTPLRWERERGRVVSYINTPYDGPFEGNARPDKGRMSLSSDQLAKGHDTEAKRLRDAYGFDYVTKPTKG